MKRMRWQSTTRVLCALVLLGPLSGCDSLLEVSNPTAITEDNLQGDEQSLTFMARGIQGEVRREYIWMAAMGAAFTDEGISGHPWQPWNAYDERTVAPENGAHAGFTYGLLQRARGTADALLPKMRTALGARAANHPQFAVALAYAGYAYLLMADHLCSAPVEALGRPVTADSMYAMAARNFDEAVRVATAASDAETANLARVGLARAHLNRGQHAQAIQVANVVPANFVAWLKYVPDASLSGWQMYNFLDWWAGDKGAELDLAYETTFALQDKRIPRRAVLETMSDGRRQGYRPMQTSSYSGWKVDGAGEMFDEGTAVRFASGLEARYMVAEASLAGGTGGLAPAAIVSFINERRAAGGLTNYSGGTATTELRTELLEQRKRDFYLAGYRVGDLRRYKRLYQLDLWPKGTMPGLTRSYGSDECWPMDSNELNGNPNARQ
jgi:SusD family